MARIKIKNLPKDRKISKEELKKIFVGATLLQNTSPISGLYIGAAVNPSA